MTETNFPERKGSIPVPPSKRRYSAPVSEWALASASRNGERGFDLYLGFGRFLQNVPATPTQDEGSYLLFRLHPQDVLALAKDVVRQLDPSIEQKILSTLKSIDRKLN